MRQKIANSLSYKFCKNGLFFLPLSTYTLIPPGNVTKFISFFFVSLHRMKEKVLLALNKMKPLGPSSIPAWARKNAASELWQPVSLLINESKKN